MRTDDKSIIKHEIPFSTHLGCYSDDLWIIPLQVNHTEAPEIYENGVVDNHGNPYIEIFHGDDELPEHPGKKNLWKVKVQCINADNECEIYASGEFKSAREALNNRIVLAAVEKAKLIQKRNLLMQTL